MWFQKLPCNSSFCLQFLLFKLREKGLEQVPQILLTPHLSSTGTKTIFPGRERGSEVGRDLSLRPEPLGCLAPAQAPCLRPKRAHPRKLPTYLETSLRELARGEAGRAWHAGTCCESAPPIVFCSCQRLVQAGKCSSGPAPVPKKPRVKGRPFSPSHYPPRVFAALPSWVGQRSREPGWRWELSGACAGMAYPGRVPDRWCPFQFISRWFRLPTKPVSTSCS